MALFDYIQPHADKKSADYYTVFKKYPIFATGYIIPVSLQIN